MDDLKPHRVGVIRADQHAYWYASLMQDVPWQVLRELSPGTHWPHYWPTRPHERRVPCTRLFKITKVFDPNPAAAEKFLRIVPEAKLCKSPQEVASDVDAVFLANCSGEAEDHLQLAEPVLATGVPTFIDKPFAYSLEDAIRLVKLARQHRALLLSASILHYQREVVAIGQRFSEVGRPLLLVVKGPAGKSNRAAIVHSFAAAQTIFGNEVETVQTIGATPWRYNVIRYLDGREAVVICAWGDSYFGWQVDLFGTDSHVAISRRPGDWEVWEGSVRILEEFARMIRTSQQPRTHSDLLAWITLWECARLSQQRGQPVRFSELSASWQELV